jgi:integrase
MRTTGKSDQREAEKELHRIMEPFAAGDKAAVLQNVVARLDGQQQEIERMEKEKQDEENPPLSIENAWNAYERAGNRKEIGAMTFRNYQSYWKTFDEWIKKHHAELKELRQVTFLVAEEYWQYLIGKNFTGRTCNAHRAFLRAFFNVVAEKARLPAGNPWARIEKRDEHSLGRRPLTVAELHKVCGKAKGEIRTLLALGLYLGCRLGDAACMDWGSIDLVRGTARYMPRKTSRTQENPVVVPLHPILAKILAATPPAKRMGPLMPDMAARYERYGPDGVTRLVQAHFEACELNVTSKREGAGKRKRVEVGFHSLRHTAVSMLRQAGAAQSISQAIVGHSSKEVHDLYTHADEEAMRRAVALLPPMTEEDGIQAAVTPKVVDAATVRELAEKMTDKNWSKTRKSLLALTSGIAGKKAK